MKRQKFCYHGFVDGNALKHVWQMHLHLFMKHMKMLPNGSALVTGAAATIRFGIIAEVWIRCSSRRRRDAYARLGSAELAIMVLRKSLQSARFA